MTDLPGMWEPSDLSGGWADAANDSLEARREHEPECERSKTCAESSYHDHTWRGDCVIPCICPALRAAFARGVESRPPVDVEAALDEWARKTLRYAMNVGREDFGSPTRAELLDLLRTVTTPSEPLTLAQLEALPVGSVVLDDRELSWQTDESGMWTRLDWRCTSGDMLITFGPVRLLHTGTATKED